MRVAASETTYLCKNKTVDSDTSLRTFDIISFNSFRSNPD